MDTLFKVLNTEDTYFYINDDSGAGLKVGDYGILNGKLYKVHSRTLDITNSTWTIMLERCKDKSEVTLLNGKPIKEDNND